MRLLYLTDTHIRGNSPENRIDSFADTLKAKIQEVIEIADRYEVDYILHGGDFFDSPSPSLGVTGEFLELFKELRQPIYVISGNHDIFGANLNSLPRTLLGFLDRLGFINLLLPGEKIFLNKHNTCLQLSGQPYHYEIDIRPPELDYQITKGQADLAVHMVHGMLCNDKDFPGNLTLVDDILSTEADLTLAGHNHLGFGVICKNNRWFANPGALVRLSNNKREISRKIAVLLIKAEGSTLSCETIELKSALPGDEVLDRSKMEERLNMEHKLEMFASEIKQAADLERMNARKIVEEIVASLGESKEVQEEALRRIALMEERLGQEGRL